MPENESSRPATSRLQAAYQRTLYCVLLDHGEIVLRVAHYDLEADRQLCRAFSLKKRWNIVTPYNPLSQSTSQAENRRHLSCLIAQLDERGQRWAPSVNRDPDGVWPDEAGVLLCDPPEGLAEMLGRYYRQHAILSGQPGEPPVLVWLSSAHAGR